MRWGNSYCPLRLAGHVEPAGAAGEIAELGDGVTGVPVVVCAEGELVVTVMVTGVVRSVLRVLGVRDEVLMLTVVDPVE